MRTLTAGETTLLDGANYAIFQRVKVQNGAIGGASTLIDYSDYVERVTVDEDIDQPTAQATVEFRRDASATVSLSPLRTDSTLNVAEDGTTYSPALDAGRQITIEVATVAIGSTPGVSDWKLLFTGYIDSVDAASPTVVVVCRDNGGILVDRWIETESKYGFDTAMETVMQSVLDEALGVSDAPTLYTPVSPSFLQRTYQQQSESVMDALIAFTQQIGWDVRYRWDNGTSAFRLTLMEPPRSNTTPDRTFGPSTYYAVSRLILDRVGVRNYVTINHKTSATGDRVDTAVFDTTSITRYGRRFFGITESDESSVDTTAEAATLANAILSDLKDPKAEMEIEAQFFWPAQLHDLYRFSDNDVHFNTNQDWAVTNIRHDLYGGSGRTYLQVRGTPAGGYLSWMSRDTRFRPPEKPLFNRILNFREVERTATTATFGWTWERTPLEGWLWLSTPVQPVGSDPYAELNGASRTLADGTALQLIRLTAATTSYEVTIPAQGLITYGRLVPLYENGVVGAAWDFTVQPGTAERLIQSAEITATTANDITVRVHVADPTPDNDITITYAVVGCTASPASGQTIPAASVTADIATTGYVDFTVTRGTGTSGRITFTATSPDRLSDSDAVDIPADRVIAGGTAPTVATTLSTSQLGTGYSLTISGKDTAGTVTLVTGPGPLSAIGADTVYFTITFGTAFSATPHGVVVPATSVATEYPTFLSATTTTASVSNGSQAIAGLNGSSTYKWSYVVIG